jgi:biuret amidohydrolase
VLRDCCAFEPTVRHSADLGYIPIVVTDACGSGDPEAEERSVATMKFTGDAILTDIEAIVATLSQLKRT